MTSDDQFFFDYVSSITSPILNQSSTNPVPHTQLSSIPHDVRKYSHDVANEIDRHVDNAATVVRDTLSEQTWIPQSIRPRPSPSAYPDVRSGAWTDRVQDWFLRHGAWSAAVLAFVGTTCVLYYGNKKLNGRRRKARRAMNGARKEIVVIAGSPQDPMAKSIAVDLERRGFIVYITVSSAEEERIVQLENRVDVRALWVDLTTTPSSPSDIHPSLQGIRSLITQPQSPMPGVPPHTCQLSGLIVIPSSHYVTGPVAAIPPSAWADTVNTRILSPVLMTQLLLPLLTLRSTPSNIVLAYPSISSSFSAPFAGPEIATTRALSGFATSLRRELGLLQDGKVGVVELRLGNIDLGPSSRQGHGRVTGTEVLAWTAQQRAQYGPQYLSSIEQRPMASAGPRTVRGSPARTLHHAVLEALEPPSKNIFGQRTTKTGVMYAGRGARTYSVIGAWVPGGLVGWMLGVRSGQGVVMDRPSSGSGSETGWEKQSADLRSRPPGGSPK